MRDVAQAEIMPFTRPQAGRDGCHTGPALSFFSSSGKADQGSIARASPILRRTSLRR
jgi:hypothetical protein